MQENTDKKNTAEVKEAAAPPKKEKSGDEAKEKLSVKNFVALTAAGTVNAIGVTLFIQPVKLYDSGISGTSMLLSQMTPKQFSLSLFLLLLNIPLFQFGYKKLGRNFTIYSIYSVFIYSMAALLITDVLPIDVRFTSPLAGKDLLLCALFGGSISGLGSGLAVRYGGAIDGIDVLAVIFSKRLGISLGTFVMIYNVVLYIFCGIFIHSWILPLYSVVTYTAASKTVDFIAEGIDRSKSVMIISSKGEEVAKALMEEFDSGATILMGKGGFSGEERQIIYFVVNRFQIARVRECVKKVESSAFMTITEVTDVFHV